MNRAPAAVRRGIAIAMAIGSFGTGPVCAQEPDLAAVKASEQRRTAVVDRCAPAVCSVMDMSSPGGGSGVVFDPRGFLLTNYHVVGEPDKPAKDEPEKGEKKAGDAEAEGDAPDAAAVPSPSPAELEQWERANPGATAAARAEFVARWQQEWRAENLATGKHRWRNKKVGLPDGELYEAVVLGVDPGSDLAVLRLLGKTPDQTWPWCPLGDSDALLVGETVFAMGNPFLLATDFTPTVTFGIVSGTHRYQEGAGNRMLVYPDCIQVDAPVNPGNSGGPLFNERGEVVGINGRISIGDRGRVNVGVGFAIASNQIRNFLFDLLAGRHAEHGTLDLSAWYMAAPKDETKRRGVFVQQMFKDSVAAAAGVALGDEITSFNGIGVRSANQLATLVGVLPAGTWVSLGHRPARDDGGHGEERTVDVRLARLDTGSSADASSDSARLASRAMRRVATRALLDRWRPAATTAAGVEWSMTGPDGVTHRYRARGEQLRLDRGDLALVRTAAGQGFAVAGGVARDLTAEEQAHLDRHLRGNPLLWSSGELPARLAAALLVGGHHVLGAPAASFAHDGDGEVETMVYEDGSPAGCAVRDPLRKQKIELHVRGASIRVIADGAIDRGWKVDGPRPAALTDDLFRRP